MDYILIYERAIVAIMLHNFVLSNQASEYFAVMAHMWEFGGRDKDLFFRDEYGDVWT
jgi:hypothetical protein